MRNRSLLIANHFPVFTLSIVLYVLLIETTIINKSYHGDLIKHRFHKLTVMFGNLLAAILLNEPSFKFSPEFMKHVFHKISTTEDR